MQLTFPVAINTRNKKEWDMVVRFATIEGFKWDPREVLPPDPIARWGADTHVNLYGGSSRLMNCDTRHRFGIKISFERFLEKTDDFDD